MLNDPKTVLESIVALSTEPVEGLSSMMETINEHIQFYENMPFLVKPFIRKDLMAITNLKEKELLDLLNLLKGNLEKIKTAASSIKDIDRSIDEQIFDDLKPMIQMEKSVEEIKTPALQKTGQENFVDEKDSPPVHEEKKPMKTLIYCPECGHHCRGQKGLKIHIYRVHKDSREEILKTIELYKI